MRTLLLGSALFLAALGPGCAPRAKLMVLRPAELDVAGIGRLAVVDFDGSGETGKIARSVLLTHLSENRHYAVVDQAELARVQPAAFVSGHPDEGAVVAAARGAGVDAILTGQVVSYNVDDNLQEDHHISIGGAGSASTRGDSASAFGIGFESNSLFSREASVSLAYKLIDARTGEVRAARQVTHTFEGQVRNGNGVLPGRERVLGDLLNACSQDVLRQIAPHMMPVEVKLANQFWGNGLSDLRRGNTLARRGQWAAAAEAWQAALQNNPRNHAALHNLALAAAADGNFEAALTQVKKAVDVYADSDYHATRSLLAEQHKLAQAAIAQANARPTFSPLPPASSPPYIAPLPQNMLPTVTPAAFVAGEASPPAPPGPFAPMQAPANVSAIQPLPAP